MATALTSWHKFIFPWIEGLPEPAFLNAVRQSVIDFCEETLLLTETLAAISVVADQQSYSLTPLTSESRIISVENVKYKVDGADNDQYKRLDPLSRLQEDRHQAGNWLFEESEQPSHFFNYQKSPATIYLWPIPTEASASGLLVRVCLRPTDTATSVEDWLYNFHRKTISFGALGRLFAQKAMPWYDPQLSIYYNEKFDERVNNEKWKKFTGAADTPMRVRLRKGISL